MQRTPKEMTIDEALKSGKPLMIEIKYLADYVPITADRLRNLVFRASEEIEFRCLLVGRTVYVDLHNGRSN